MEKSPLALPLGCFCILKQNNLHISWFAQIKAAVKVNAEQLLFNWQLGRDLVMRKAEERWGSGIVEQVSLDLQAAFPESKGFSAANLWRMKQWYLFYSSSAEKLAQIARADVFRFTAMSALPRKSKKICFSLGLLEFPTARLFTASPRKSKKICFSLGLLVNLQNL